MIRGKSYSDGLSGSKVVLGIGKCPVLTVLCAIVVPYQDKIRQWDFNSKGVPAWYFTENMVNTAGGKTSGKLGTVLSLPLSARDPFLGSTKWSNPDPWLVQIKGDCVFRVAR